MALKLAQVELTWPINLKGGNKIQLCKLIFLETFSSAWNMLTEICILQTQFNLLGTYALPGHIINALITPAFVFSNIN